MCCFTALICSFRARSAPPVGNKLNFFIILQFGYFPVGFEQLREVALLLSASPLAQFCANRKFWECQCLQCALVCTLSDIRVACIALAFVVCIDWHKSVSWLYGACEARGCRFCLVACSNVAGYAPGERLLVADYCTSRRSTWRMDRDERATEGCGDRDRE